MTQSIIYDAKPQYSDDRYWAKRIRSKSKLKLPNAIHGTKDIPGQKLPIGPVVLETGYFLIEGEQYEPSFPTSRWDYRVQYLGINGKLCTFAPDVWKCRHGSDAGMFAPTQLAECVRIIHELREGEVSTLMPIETETMGVTIEEYIRTAFLKDAWFVAKTVRHEPSPWQIIRQAKLMKAMGKMDVVGEEIGSLVE